MDRMEITPPDNKELITKSLDLKAQFQAIAITDNMSYELAGKIAVEIKTWIKTVEAKFQESCDAAFRAHRAITSFKNETLKPYQDLQAEVNRSMTTYRIKVEEKRQEEARKAAEKARIEAEAARKAEVKAAEKAGDKEGAKNLKQAPIIPVSAPPKTAEPPKIKGMAVRKIWDFTVTDENKIPRKFFVLDETAIRGVVKSLGDKHGIPGITAFQKEVQ